MGLRTRSRRRDVDAMQVWTAITPEAREHFRAVAGGSCGCSACWLLRANGLTTPPREGEIAS